MYWAYNDHRQLVAAVQAHPDQNYWCPQCGAVVQVRRGRVNRAYFAHESTAISVDPKETLSMLLVSGSWLL